VGEEPEAGYPEPTRGGLQQRRWGVQLLGRAVAVFEVVVALSGEGFAEASAKLRTGVWHARKAITNKGVMLYNALTSIQIKERREKGRPIGRPEPRGRNGT